MGVLGGSFGHLWESLRVPWDHLGSACGALAVLKIIGKLLVSIVFPAMGHAWPTLEHLWFVLWGRWVLFGAPWTLLRSPRALLGVPLGIHEGLGRRLRSPWGPLDGPKELTGAIGKFYLSNEWSNHL